ncbi:MAG TPA: 3-phosphoshikimate 1-carboxyvinyltransferase, partial [Clostridiales bacterium]|nr:3-phosphoshikimate 1-carboxyvinyltransferase [Clostridiales bacterium]
MNYTINACRLAGKVKAIPSKSHLHRQLIAAALYGTDTEIRAGAAASEDITATENCLTALGAQILRSEADRIHVKAIRERRREEGVRRLFCKESGSTLRFLLPVACALGLPAEFYPEGRLPDRPLSPLREELIRHGCRISEPGSVPLCVEGTLSGGVFEIAGGVSSQYISGILLALPLLEAESTLRITGTLESRPYVEMTLEVLAGFGISFTENSGFSVFIKPRGLHRAQTAQCLQTEGDWSNAAFWLTAGAIGTKEVCVSGLSLTSKQGDKAILQLLKQFGASVKAAEAEDGLSEITVSPSPL